MIQRSLACFIQTDFLPYLCYRRRFQSNKEKHKENKEKESKTYVQVT